VWREKVSVWRQDIYSTAMFLSFLAIEYFLKKLILG
jgi:hypothetical protein